MFAYRRSEETLDGYAPDVRKAVEPQHCTFAEQIRMCKDLSVSSPRLAVNSLVRFDDKKVSLLLLLDRRQSAPLSGDASEPRSGALNAWLARSRVRQARPSVPLVAADAPGRS